MTKKHITRSFCSISPQSERDNLWLIINQMMNNNLNNKQSLCVYNILYGVYQLLIHYETICREVVLITEIEADPQKMRKHIRCLCKDALYKNLRITKISTEDIDV